MLMHQATLIAAQARQLAVSGRCTITTVYSVIGREGDYRIVDELGEEYELKAETARGAIAESYSHIYSGTQV